MTKIDVMYAQIPYNISTYNYESFLSSFPENLRKKSREYSNMSDRLLNLYGLYLLKEKLITLGFEADVLKNIKYNYFMRPYLPDSIDFNISHSGDYVVCAVGDNISVGIDIEKVQPINFEDFADVMTDKEWELIYAAPEPLIMFYNFWTIKESVIKADSRGLSLPLKEISIGADNALCKGMHWHIKALEIDDRYQAHICTDIKLEKIFLHEVKVF